MRQSFLYLHLAVLLAGGTGLFGRLISLTELPLVWYRMMFAVAVAVPILTLMKQLHRISLRDAMQIAGCGMIMAVHWIFFYGSIQASNVSIGVICLTLVSFFTSIFEPMVGHRRPSVREVILSTLPVLGILLIFQLDTRYRTGIMMGVISSAACSAFSITSKQVIARKGHKSSTMLVYELAGGAALLTLIMPFVAMQKPELPMVPSMQDLLYLLLLSSVFTVGAFLCQLKALQNISAFTMTLTYNLEPVYSILFAMILFNEGSELGRSFWVGVLLIVISVVAQTQSVRKRRA